MMNIEEPHKYSLKKHWTDRREFYEEKTNLGYGNIIINYEKYDLVDNEITYDGLEYELMDGSLVSYDSEGVANIIPLPVEENRITEY